MARVISRAVVAFNAEGAGEGPLSWGQQDIWSSMTRYGHAMPLGGIKPLEPGSTIASITSELRYLMTRYPVMRTRLRLEPLRQVVSARGQIILEIVDADGDPDLEAGEVLSAYRERPFDYEKEWPVRMAVVRSGQILTHLVVIMHHLALDGFAGRVMMAETTAKTAEPPAGMQPLEQARWQAAPAGQRQNEAALKHWEATLETMPKPWPHGPGRPQEPRHWEGYFRSPAMYLAVQGLTRRFGMDAAPILLTAYATAVARLSGTSPVVLRPVANNRFRPGLSNVVCPVSQAGICLLDVGLVPFGEALQRTAKASLVAFKHSYFDPARMQEIAAKVMARRGPEFFVDSFYNDRRMSGRFDGQPVSAPSEFRWTASKNTPSARLYVQVEDEPDTVLLNIFADTHFVPLAVAERLLFEMEAVAVEAMASDGGSDR